MELTLHNFETVLSNEIINKGKAILDNGSIIELEKIGVKDFNAIVTGTIHYTVNVVLTHDDVIFTHRCSCPYTSSPICKHKTALLLLIKQGLVNTIATENGNLNRIDKQLQKCDKKVLHQLILTIAKIDLNGRKIILDSLRFVKDSM